MELFSLLNSGEISSLCLWTSFVSSYLVVKHNVKPIDTFPAFCFYFQSLKTIFPKVFSTNDTTLTEKKIGRLVQSPNLWSKR